MSKTVMVMFLAFLFLIYNISVGSYVYERKLNFVSCEAMEKIKEQIETISKSCTPERMNEYKNSPLHEDGRIILYGWEIIILFMIYINYDELFGRN
jgi:hypothetical protein